MNTEFIPQDLYDNIIDLIPIVCVDGVIQKENGVLLLLRDNEPEKNKWWFPGGRLLKGEKLEEGIVRKVKEETGLICEVIDMIDITQTDFNTGPNGIPVHTINVCFTLKIKNGKLSLNNEHKKWGWFMKAPEDSHVVIKDIFKKINK